jgi:hypothetical protein
MTDQERHPSVVSPVKDSLHISRDVQSQAGQGFNEIIVRNPQTNDERVIVVLARAGAKNEAKAGQ